MMRPLLRRPKRDAGAQDLVNNVWCLDDAQHWRTDAYLNHCDVHIAQTQATLYDDIDAAVVQKLIALVKNKRASSVPDIIDAIRQASTEWSQTAYNDNAARTALDLVLKLWLFAGHSLQDFAAANASQTLLDASRHSHELIATHLRKRPHVLDLQLLSADFSAKSLTRKGGFYIVWTSDLSEHLNFVPNSKTQLQVFRHAQVLKLYQKDNTSAEMFPPDFLEETYRTINLLFPFEDSKESKRIRRKQRRHHVDIEAANLEKTIDEYEKYQLETYVYYRSRLAEIQRRYDSAKPRRLKQWWFDRRQRTEWAALMVALIVFVLTVVFGVIQCITGILQVAIAQQGLNTSSV